MTPLASIILLVVLILVGALVVTCALERFGSQVHRHPNQQRAQGQAEPYQEYSTPYSRMWYLLVAILFLGFLCLMAYAYVNDWKAGGWTAVFSLALVFSTVAQALFAKWQRDVMQQQLSQAQVTVEHMRQEQRPWLGATHATIGDLAIGKPLDIKIYIRNTGKTPGRVYEQTTVTLVYPLNEAGLALPEDEAERQLENNIEANYDKMPLHQGTEVILPGAQIWVRALNKPGDPIILDKEMYERIVHNQSKVYAVTAFSYGDIHLDRRYDTVRFNFIYRPAIHELVTAGFHIKKVRSNKYR